MPSGAATNAVTGGSGGPEFREKRTARPAQRQRLFLQLRGDKPHVIGDRLDPFGIVADGLRGFFHRVRIAGHLQAARVDVAGRLALIGDDLGNMRRAFGYQVDLVGDATVEQPGRQPQDGYGHGTHIMSTVAHPAYERNARYTGIAPGADLVSVRAFDDAGLGSYIDVIEGIDWVLRQREALDIRVLNLSFGAQPQSRYWDDPLNQAVMAAWEAGIVVVASAGNEGPDAMTIGVPGNVPYVITVGAASDNHTWRDVSDDFLSTFSSAGPTTEAFVKPDLLGPGDRVLGLMPPASHLAQTYGAQSQVRGAYHALSGTSQAAAITSG